MKLHTYQYGQAARLPGLSIGVTRHLPRGVNRRDYASAGYFEIWLPLLAPSAKLLAAHRQGALPFKTFAARYRAEMKRPEPRQTIRLLAAVAMRQPVKLGCFCADPKQCHRSLLASLIADAAGEISQPGATEPRSYASPACLMPEIED